MPIKYQRETAKPEVAPRIGPFQRLAPAGAPAMRRNWRLYVLVLVGFVLIAGPLWQEGKGPIAAFLWPQVHGEAIILEKLPADAGPCAVRLAVQLDPAPIEVRAAMPCSAWERLAEGDRIAVLYRGGTRGRALEVDEVGLVALDPAPR